MKLKSGIFLLSLLCVLSCREEPSPVATHGNKEAIAADTNRINSLNELSETYWRGGVYDSALIFAYQAKALAEKEKFTNGLINANNNIGIVNMFESNYPQALSSFARIISIATQANKKKSIATAHTNMGLTYVDLGEYSKALESYHLALDIYKEFNQKKGIANVYGNIAVVYDNQGKYPEAVKAYLSSLKLFEEIGYKTGIANSYNNIGDCYNNQGKYKDALKSHLASLKIKKEINDKPGIASSYTNIGLTYDNMGNYQEAFEYYQSSLEMYKELGDDWGLGLIYDNIGAVYMNQLKYDEALKNYLPSLQIRERIDDKEGIANSCNNIGSLYIETKKYPQASAYLNRALSVSKEIGSLAHVRDSYTYLARLDSSTGNYKNAYTHYKLSVAYRDSMQNKENTEKIVQQQMQYEFDKKDALAKAEQKQKDAITASEKQKQQLVLSFVMIGLVLVIVFSIFMYNRFRVTRKQKQIIEVQKTEVEVQRQLAEEKRILAEEQKHIIEEKQKEILDSIHYAKRIQGAMLTSREYITKHFKAEYFIFYQPKDIVSGDFYWAVEQGNRFYIATADCTGHGVPGAFMSLLNINFLNANILEKQISDPSMILNEQRLSIIKALNPTGTENSKDGMDCVLCAFDLQNDQLQFAAANNPLWHIRNNELIEYKADKMPVGKYDENAKDFTLQTMGLQKGDLIYTFTDGYADQFGGPKGKKFKYKQLEQILLANSHLGLKEQETILAETINDWKGELEQVDDILIIGIRI